MEQENSPRAPVSLPGGSVAPSSSFPFNSVKHSLFGLRLGNEILIAPLRTRISRCALPQPADSFFGLFFFLNGGAVASRGPSAMPGLAAVPGTFPWPHGKQVPTEHRCERAHLGFVSPSVQRR